MGSASNVLVIGNDERLLQLRGQVLRGAGFDVEEAATEGEMTVAVRSNAVGVVVLCHTLRDDQLTHVLRLLDERSDRPRLLMMMRAATHNHDGAIVAADALLDRGDGPVQLIAAVKSLMS